jgi:cytochrome P450
LPYVIRALQGRLAYDVLKLHERYGPMIRVAPNELALAYEGVWDEVQGGTYETEMQKWKPYYRVQPDQIGFIFTAPPEEHSKMRRTLSYGFSDRGIRDLEPRMIEVLDKMMRRLLDICGDRESWSSHQSARVGTQTGEAVVDITEWLNFLTFDMIGELTFGESYECLEKASYHPWVKPVVELTHYSGILANLGFYPKFQGLLLKAFGGLICRRMEFHQKHSRAALERRAAKPNRSDLLSEPLKQTQASLDVSKTAS